MAEAEDSEWLLWCTRLKIEHTKIFNQLSDLTRATSQIEALVGKVADLIESNELVHAENKTLKDRIIRLEKDSKQHENVESAKSQSIDDLRAEKEALRDRIIRLEQEANQQDQINAVNSQAKATLEQQYKILKMEFNSVTNAVSNMQKTARLERQGQKKDLEEMRVQITAFIDGASRRDNGPADEGSKIITGLFPTATSRRAMSQATTADESMPVDTENETRRFGSTTRVESQIVDATQLHTQYLDSIEPTTTDPKMDMNMRAQGVSSLDDYVRHGDTVITESVSRYEAQAVYKFVSGLNDQYRQHLLREILNKEGWSWLKAKTELQRMGKDAERMKKRRRVLSLDFNDTQL